MHNKLRANQKLFTWAILSHWSQSISEFSWSIMSMHRKLCRLACYRPLANKKFTPWRILQTDYFTHLRLLRRRCIEKHTLGTTTDAQEAPGLLTNIHPSDTNEQKQMHKLKRTQHNPSASSTSIHTACKQMHSQTHTHTHTFKHKHAAPKVSARKSKPPRP